MASTSPSTPQGQQIDPTANEVTADVQATTTSQAAATDNTSTSTQRALFASVDDAIFEESDEDGFSDSGDSDPFPGTVLVFHWIPDEVPNTTKMGAVIVLATRPFQDNIMVWKMLKKGQHEDKKEILAHYKKNIVPRVVNATMDGKVVSLPGQDEGDTWPIKGLMFNYKNFTREHVEKLLHGRIVPHMKNNLKKNWKMNDNVVPMIKPGDNEYKVVKKLSHVLHDEDDIYWHIQHTFNGKWKNWLNIPGNIYQVWDEGSVPIHVMRAKGCNRNMLRPADLDKYNAAYPPPTEPEPKKPRASA